MHISSFWWVLSLAAQQQRRLTVLKVAESAGVCRYRNQTHGQPKATGVRSLRRLVSVPVRLRPWSASMMVFSKYSILSAESAVSVYPPASYVVCRHGLAETDSVAGTRRHMLRTWRRVSACGCTSFGKQTQFVCGGWRFGVPEGCLIAT